MLSTEKTSTNPRPEWMLSSRIAGKQWVPAVSRISTVWKIPSEREAAISDPSELSAFRGPPVGDPNLDHT